MKTQTRKDSRRRTEGLKALSHELQSEARRSGEQTDDGDTLRKTSNSEETLVSATHGAVREGGRGSARQAVDRIEPVTPAKSVGSSLWHALLRSNLFQYFSTKKCRTSLLKLQTE